MTNVLGTHSRSSWTNYTSIFQLFLSSYLSEYTHRIFQWLFSAYDRPSKNDHILSIWLSDMTDKQNVHTFRRLVLFVLHWKEIDLLIKRRTTRMLSWTTNWFRYLWQCYPIHTCKSPQENDSKLRMTMISIRCWRTYWSHIWMWNSKSQMPIHLNRQIRKESR